MNQNGTSTTRWRIEALSTALCAVFMVAGWLTASSILFPLAYAAGGWDATRKAARSLRRGEIHVDLLMILAATGAAVVGHWLEGAILLFLFSLGNTLETYAFHRTRHSIRSLVALRPMTAARIDEGVERTVAVEDLQPGQRVRVRPGERIPVDGTIRRGRSSIDESTLTGEAIPVSKSEGADVFAGTLNGEGSIDVEVTRPAHDTTLARVIRMVEEAREAKAPAQTWLERTEGRYAGAVILASALAVVFPVALLGWSLGDAFFRAMTLLVVASPCALVISIPATIISAVSNAARHGVLFKGGAHLDALASVQAIALDKTGTVTRGRPEVMGFSLLSPESRAMGEERFLELVASAESHSEHHLAKALLKAAEKAGVGTLDTRDFISHPGRGVEGFVGPSKVEVGRRSWVEERVGEPLPPDADEWLDVEGRRMATPVFVAIDGRHAGVFAVADRPRAGVREAVNALRALGVRHIVMLTGDDPGTAAEIAKQVGISEVRAGLLPEEKSAAIEEIRARYGPVAMVGDGVNDAPALATADLGVAVGAAGTDVALETADLVLMGEDLDGLVYARKLSVRARRVVLQNLVFASGVLLTLVGLALVGKVGLTTGVLGHEGSTIIVVLNGLRLLRVSRERPRDLADAQRPTPRGSPSTDVGLEPTLRPSYPVET